jgi:hypothetical protein
MGRKFPEYGNFGKAFFDFNKKEEKILAMGGKM